MDSTKTDQSEFALRLKDAMAPLRTVTRYLTIAVVALTVMSVVGGQPVSTPMNAVMLGLLVLSSATLMVTEAVLNGAEKRMAADQ